MNKEIAKEKMNELKIDISRCNVLVSTINATKIWNKYRKEWIFPNEPFEYLECASRHLMSEALTLIKDGVRVRKDILNSILKIDDFVGNCACETVLINPANFRPYPYKVETKENVDFSEVMDEMLENISVLSKIDINECGDLEFFFDFYAKTKDKIHFCENIPEDFEVSLQSITDLIDKFIIDIEVMGDKDRVGLADIINKLILHY